MLQDRLRMRRCATSGLSRLRAVTCQWRRFGERILGTAQWSFLQTSPRVAHIYGSKGHIAVERVNCPERLTLTRSGSEPKVRITYV